MIRYIIIDDEHIAHDIIKGYCDVLPNMQLVKDCYDAIEALDYLRENHVDLIFLDLNMPKLKGFDFLRTLPYPPKVIVTTAYKEYALEGYELEITDYLLKPFSFERFLKAVNKTVHAPKADTAKTQSAEVNNRDSIFLYSNNKYVQVKTGDILFVEAAGNYSKIVFADHNILIREKISDMLEILSAEEFIQVHKSFVVAKQHINHIEGASINIAEHIIPVGKTYKANVSNLL